MIGYTPPSDTTPLAQVFAELRAMTAATPATQAATNVPFPSGTGGFTLTVTFPQPFDTIPAVVVTSGNASLTNPRVFSKNNLGFAVRFDRDATGTYTFDWIAVEPAV